VRLRVPPLRHKPALGDHLVTFLTRQPGIRDAHATAACASLTISYAPTQVDLAQINAWGRTALATPPSDTRRASTSARPSAAALVCGGAALGLSLLGAPLAVTAGLLAVSAAPIFVRAGQDLLAERQLTADALDATAVTALALQGNLLAATLSA